MEYSLCPLWKLQSRREQKSLSLQYQRFIILNSDWTVELHLLLTITSVSESHIHFQPIMRKMILLLKLFKIQCHEQTFICILCNALMEIKYLSLNWYEWLHTLISYLVFVVRCTCRILPSTELLPSRIDPNVNWMTAF